MPDFQAEEISIEPYEFVSACRPSEIRELIVELVDEGHLPKSVLAQIAVDKNGKSKTTVLEDDFIEKMGKLSEKYHMISKEDEETLETIIKKYI